MEWRETTRVLCNKTLVLKRKIDETVVKPIIMYESKRQAVNKKKEKNESYINENANVDVWCDQIMNRIMNEYIGGS